jgi:hypothetical protein
MHARENFDKRAFARAVLTGQNMNFAAPHFKLRVRQNRRAAKSLGDVRQTNQRSGFCFNSIRHAKPKSAVIKCGSFLLPEIRPDVIEDLRLSLELLRFVKNLPKPNDFAVTQDKNRWR